mmetsp:Transcript_15535/g.38981  ORF Transcript_15535/g.38981 Transcript_15535/m.38981 type:complete len:214 (+) Transcript_15535:1197-1838(+)
MVGPSSLSSSGFSSIRGPSSSSSSSSELASILGPSSSPSSSGLSSIRGPSSFSSSSSASPLSSRRSTPSSAGTPSSGSSVMSSMRGPSSYSLGAGSKNSTPAGGLMFAMYSCSNSCFSDASQPPISLIRPLSFACSRAWNSASHFWLYACLIVDFFLAFARSSSSFRRAANAAFAASSCLAHSEFVGSSRTASENACTASSYLSSRIRQEPWR